MSQIAFFNLPDVGEGLTEAEIVSWKVKAGDTVEVNQVIVEIETAKSLVELPVPFAGVVDSLLCAEGDTVEVGKPIISATVADGAVGAKEDDDQEEDGDEDDEGGDSDPAMKPKKGAEASTDRVKAVADAVANDPACKGKAELALSMLADDDFAGLSASGIVKLLGKTPVSGASANDADADAAARAEMQAALAETTNSNIDANVPPAGSAQANSTSVWDKAIARVCPSPAK